jgi:hypothetical protein
MAFAPAGRDRALLAVGMALEAALACSGASVVP